MATRIFIFIRSRAVAEVYNDKVSIKKTEAEKIIENGWSWERAWWSFNDF